MRVPAAAVIFSFLCSGAFAQENPTVEPRQQATTTTPILPAQTPSESSSIHPKWGSDRSALPDAPRPQLDDHERTPCPEGEFKPCALLGGKRYLPDHTRMTQHDKTVWDGFTHPMILAGSALLVATTIYDIEGTQSCLRAGTCRETNPIYGSHPSRARAYSIAMPLNGFLIYLSARQKRRGDGNTGFAALYLSSAVHFYFGRSAYSAASARP
jgi:hypothetical protein